MKTVEVGIFDEKNMARLSAKSYVKAYTHIPNRALPISVKEPLALVFKSLTGQEFLEEESTFLVRANNGVFKKLLTPSVYAKEDGVVIRWGAEDIGLSLAGGKVSAINGDKKLRFKFGRIQQGKFSQVVLSLGYAVEGVLYSMNFPIRSLDWENPVEMEALDMLLEENPEAIPPLLAQAPDPNANYEEKVRFVGPTVKVAALPEGNYTVIGYRSYENSFGMDYRIQVVDVPESFTALTNVKEGENWVPTEVTVEAGSSVIVKPNNKLKTLLLADPKINPEHPAELEVYDPGEWNGHPTVKVNLICTEFSDGENSVSLDF